MSTNDPLGMLKTKEDFRLFVLSELEEGKDVLGIWSQYSFPGSFDVNDRPGDGLIKVHAALDDGRKELLEEAIFDIILDPSDFFRVTKYGSPNTISGYVGTMLVFHLTWNDKGNSNIRILSARFTKKAQEWALKIDGAIQQEQWTHPKDELVKKHIFELLKLFYHFARIALRS